MRMEFTVKVIGTGPAGLPVLQKLLSIAAAVLASPIIVMSGQPGAVELGGATYPCYNLQMALQAQTA